MVKGYVRPPMTTLEKPFELYADGIFYRENGGFGISFNGINPPLETSELLIRTLNNAYKVGYEIGAIRGISETIKLTHLPKKRRGKSENKGLGCKKIK